MRTIDYDLALKLKNAGFPQYGNNLDSDGERITEGAYPDVCYVPTLSELIEACGEDFYDLGKSPKAWNAHSRHHLLSQTEVYVGYGSTPEEAVANLWLALEDNKSV